MLWCGSAPPALGPTGRGSTPFKTDPCRQPPSSSAMLDIMMRPFGHALRSSINSVHALCCNRKPVFINVSTVVSHCPGGLGALTSHLCSFRLRLSLAESSSDKATISLSVTVLTPLPS